MNWSMRFLINFVFYHRVDHRSCLTCLSDMSADKENTIDVPGVGESIKFSSWAPHGAHSPKIHGSHASKQCNNIVEWLNNWVLQYVIQSTCKYDDTHDDLILHLLRRKLKGTLNFQFDPKHSFLCGWTSASFRAAGFLLSPQSKKWIHIQQLEYKAPRRYKG